MKLFDDVKAIADEEGNTAVLNWKKNKRYGVWSTVPVEKMNSESWETIRSIIVKESPLFRRNVIAFCVEQEIIEARIALERGRPYCGPVQVNDVRRLFSVLSEGLKHLSIALRGMHYSKQNVPHELDQRTMFDYFTRASQVDDDKE